LVLVDNHFDPRTGTFRAGAAFYNKDEALTPGIFARVKLFGHNSYRAVLVDDRAIGTDQSQKFVFVVDAQNQVQYRSVKIGKLDEGLRIVLEGLAPGEKVVVNGLQRVRPGMQVAPELVAMDARERAEALAAQSHKSSGAVVSQNAAATTKDRV
jgi:RND family efflux transporter MFP subunit